MLSGASLDLLWSAQLGLANLVKCMPSDLWEEKVWRYPWSVPGCNDRVESDLRLVSSDHEILFSALDLITSADDPEANVAGRLDTLPFLCAKSA